VDVWLIMDFESYAFSGVYSVFLALIHRQSHHHALDHYQDP
jgi:hypothetical protein